MSLLPRSTDVFVIGGGPAGLAAAIAARRRGFAVTVADCSAPPVDKACGEGIMPDGLAAARSLGLELEIPRAQPFRGIRFLDGDVSVEADFPRGCGIGLRRTLLHDLLVNRATAEGVRMAWGVRVTAIGDGHVEADGRLVRAGWIVGADGGRSPVRQWAGLDACERVSRRYGFRRHYPVAPWSPFMEIHWTNGCQLYVTPVGPSEICLVVISRDPRLRLDDALARFPVIQRRLHGCAPSTPERGGVSASRRLKAVFRGRVALVGDASGSVDAITGEGLCLLFQQSVALARALESGDLSLYQKAHREIGKRPKWMADLMLLLDRHHGLRRRAIGAMAEHPPLFSRMLAMHVGALPPAAFLRHGLSLSWRLITL